MRPTDFCHPFELRAPAPRMFPAHSRHFRGAEAPWRIRLHATTTGGPNVSRRSKDRFGGPPFVCVTPTSIALRPRASNVGVFFPRHRCDRASDTPVAIPVLSRGSCLRKIHRRSQKPPRPLPSPTRESLRLILVRDAFRRQGLFIGSGGHYSPGPATTSPLLAMVQPLDDDLSPP